ncbi:MAG: hypothetical protein FJX20_23505 [Alphaproteobacteria bacterium]|nr:hypothetical protein [Alphaproteobacteria bacterium]
MGDDAPRWLTYRHAADALGITPEAIAARARRRRWPKRTRNDSGEVEIAVPADQFPSSDSAPYQCLAGDPWNTEGSWLLVVTSAGGEPAALDHVAFSRRFDADRLDATMSELGNAWRWSQALFQLVCVRLVVRGGARTELPAPRARITPEALFGACPLWSHGAEAVRDRWLCFDRLDDHALRTSGRLPIFPNERALLTAAHGPDALGGEVVASLFWHIHM